MTTIYGIKNCDTIKRTRKALEHAGIPYQFHDFRQDGLEATHLEAWLRQIPRETLINRRGTTWRQLPDAAQQLDSDADAIELMLAHPALIKRPVIEHAGRVRVGFAKSSEQDILDWLCAS